MDKTTLIDLRQSGLIDEATFDSEIARLARDNIASERPHAMLRSEIVDSLRELNRKRHEHEGHEGRWYAERRLERQMKGASKIKLEAMLEKAVAENTRLSRLHESLDNAMMTRHSMHRSSDGYKGVLDVSNESVRIKKKHMNGRGRETKANDAKLTMPEAAARTLLALQKGRKFQFQVTAMAVVTSNKARRRKVTQNGLSNTIAAPGKLADASRQMVDAVPVSAGASLGLSATAPAGTLEGAREVAEAEAAEADKAMETSKGQKEATKQRPAERDREKKAKARAKKKAKENAAAVAAAAAAGGSNSINRKVRTSSWGSAGGGESERKKRLLFVDIASLERMLKHYGYLRCRDALFIFDAERSWVFSGKHKTRGHQAGAEGVSPPSLPPPLHSIGPEQQTMHTAYSCPSPKNKRWIKVPKVVQELVLEAEERGHVHWWRPLRSYAAASSWLSNCRDPLTGRNYTELPLEEHWWFRKFGTPLCPARFVPATSRAQVLSMLASKTFDTQAVCELFHQGSKAGLEVVEPWSC